MAAASAAGGASGGGAPPTGEAPTSAASPREVLARLQLQLTRRLDGLLQGEHLGLLSGHGSEPGESRPYVAGDDVRRLDWPLTARTTVPHVRQTVADREVTVCLVVDASASMDFGTAGCLKRDLVLAAATAITHVTVRGGSRLGALVAVGEGPPRHLPPRTGRRPAQGVLRALAGMLDRPVADPVAAGAPGPVDLGALVTRAHRTLGRRGLAVVVSDFLDSPQQWERPLRRLASRQDVVAVEVRDPRELHLPDVGVLELVDPETGRLLEVQTADRRLRERYARAAEAHTAAVADALRRAGAAHLVLRTDRDWLTDTVRFVAARRRTRPTGGHA